MTSVRLRLAALCVAALGLAAPAGVGVNGAVARAANLPAATFNLSPASPEIQACLPGAMARATVEQGATNDTLTIHAEGLPPFSGFDLFAAARPHAPYGPSWLLSQPQSDGRGRLDVQVNAILFGAFRVVDGSLTPTPTTHLVLFFDRASDADRCFRYASSPTTSFTDGRRAGPAALASIGYSDNAGPLSGRPFPRPGLGISTPGGGHRAQGTPVVFTSSCDDPAGWTAIRFVDFRFTENGRTAFWARLDRPAGLMYVYDPGSGKWLGGARPGSAGMPGSASAQLRLVDSRVVGTPGTTGKVIWNVAFAKSAGRRTFQQSVQVTDMRNQTRGWNPTGTWTVDS